MAKVKFLRKEIEKHFKLDSNTLDKISMFGTTVESINNDEIELEIPANRPDLLSLNLFAQAIKSFLGKETGLKKYKINKKEYHVTISPSVKQVRPYTSCVVIKNLKLNEEKLKEIISLQEKLHTTIGRNRKKCAIGIYPLDKISFPISYEARKPSDIKFIPLEEKKELNAWQILQLKHLKDYAKLLDKHDKFPIFVDSKKQIMSMPPIINSQETGQVTSGTKDVFIECSGHDQNTLDKIIAILTASFAEMGGEINSVTLKGEKTHLSPNLNPQITKLSIDNANKVLGLDLSEKEISNLLKKMGHEYQKSKVKSPAWRIDVLHEVDLIEDIAIAYGYDKISPQIPQIATIGESAQINTINSKIISTLVGLGFLETSSLHLITQEEAKKADLQKPLSVESSRTEYSILRPNLTIPTLRNLRENTSVEYPQKLAEIGPVFVRDSEAETGITEKNHLVLALTPGNFTEAKQTLDYLTSQLGINYELKEAEAWPYIKGRAGNIIINNIPVGIIGEVHPAVLHDWSLKLPLSLVELDLEDIYNQLI